MAFEKLARSLGVFRTIYELIPTQTVETFLHVAEHPSTTRKDIMRNCHLSRSAALRSLAMLGDDYYLNGRRKPGLKLVEPEPDPIEPRRHRYKLTPRGQRVAEQLRTILEG